ncbi:MAG TPA: hypothetical protein VF590_06675 [Isosphaeraceae bacterium]|jgi:hypothetical protein
MKPEDASAIAAVASAAAAFGIGVIAWFQVRVAGKQLRTAEKMRQIAEQQVAEQSRARSQAAAVAIMDRLAQINQLKTMRPELWDLLEEPIAAGDSVHRDNKKGLGHLIFATFKMYEEVFLMRQHKLLTEADYLPWAKRLEVDLVRWPRYVLWWQEEMERGFKDAWDTGFVKLVDQCIARAGKTASP